MHAGARQVGLNPARGLDEIDGVVRMLLDAGGDGEDVGVENDVLGGEANVVHENVVGARADFDAGARAESAWPFSSKAGMTTAAAP